MNKNSTDNLPADLASAPLATTFRGDLNQPSISTPLPATKRETAAEIPTQAPASLVFDQAGEVVRTNEVVTAKIATTQPPQAATEAVVSRPGHLALLRKFL